MEIAARSEDLERAENSRDHQTRKYIFMSIDHESGYNFSSSPLDGEISNSNSLVFQKI